MEITTNQLSLTGVIMENPQFDHEVFGEAFFRPVDEEENPNTVFLSGALGKPPSFRTTPFGREIADLMLAVNRSYGKSDYIPCIAWGRTARFASGLNVGDHVQLQGRFQSRVYQKQLPDGTVQERTAYEVSVSRLTLESAAGAPLAEHDAPSRPGYSGALQ